MKLILPFVVAIISVVSAREITEIEMASGRPLQKVTILEVTEAGVKMKHSRGRGMIPFGAFTRAGIIQAGALDLWGPAPPRVKGRPGEPSRLGDARAALAVSLVKLPHETTSSHKSRVEQALSNISWRVESAIAEHQRFAKEADEQDKEGIDSTETRKQAAQELALALTCGFGRAEKEAEAKALK